MQADEQLRNENKKLKARLESIRHACKDIETLLAASDVGILLLDEQLCIKCFTPKAAELFNLAPGDDSRNIKSVSHQFDYDGFADDALEVLRTKEIRERQVRRRNEDWSLRMRPWSLENGADCVVVALVQLSGGDLMQMASAFVHEINQPLTAAATYLNVIRRLLIAGANKPEDIVEIVDKAGKELLRTRAILSRLREGNGHAETDRTA